MNKYERRLKDTAKNIKSAKQVLKEVKDPVVAMKEYANQLMDVVYDTAYGDGMMKCGGWDVSPIESLKVLKKLIK